MQRLGLNSTNQASQEARVARKTSVLGNVNAHVLLKENDFNYNSYPYILEESESSLTDFGSLSSETSCQHQLSPLSYPNSSSCISTSSHSILSNECLETGYSELHGFARVIEQNEIFKAKRFHSEISRLFDRPKRIERGIHYKKFLSDGRLHSSVCEEKGNLCLRFYSGPMCEFPRSLRLRPSVDFSLSSCSSRDPLVDSHSDEISEHELLPKASCISAGARENSFLIRRVESGCDLYRSHMLNDTANSIRPVIFPRSCKAEENVATRYLTSRTLSQTSTQSLEEDFLGHCAQQASSSSSQTDDNVTMRYYAQRLICPTTCLRDSKRIPFCKNLGRKSSQTDDLVSLRFYTQHRPNPTTVAKATNDCQIKHEVSPSSSQTDDFVTMRFYYVPFRVSSNSSQTDDDLALRFTTEQDNLNSDCKNKSRAESTKTGAGVSMELCSYSDSSQTDDDVAKRFHGCLTLVPTSSTKLRGYNETINAFSIVQAFKTDQNIYQRMPQNPVPDIEDSETILEVRRRHMGVRDLVMSVDDPNSKQVRSQLTINFPLSYKALPPVKKPSDLTVEFEIVDEWHRIYPFEWTLQLNIAHTKTGSVDLAMLGEYNKQIALKTLRAKTSHNEAEILIECQGPFVVQLCASMVQDDERFLCMAYYYRGDLARWLKNDLNVNYICEYEAVWIVAHILAAVDFLHEKCIYHLDIKPQNILITNKGYPVLCDFSSAKRKIDLADSPVVVGFTKSYTSPEVIAGKTPDNQADLWSVVCVFYEIVVKRVPFLGITSLEIELRASLGTSLDAASLTVEAKDFICSQLKLPHTKRLGFQGGVQQLMHHPVFQPVDWEEVKNRDRKLQCRLMQLFLLIEKRKFKKKNKPDPIPPESLFYPNLNGIIELGDPLRSI